MCNPMGRTRFSPHHVHHVLHNRRSEGVWGQITRPPLIRPTSTTSTHVHPGDRPLTCTNAGVVDVVGSNPCRSPERVIARRGTGIVR